MEKISEQEHAAAEAIGFIVREIPRYGGNLAGFANSPDALDTWGPAALRDRAKTLAAEVFADADMTAQAHLALCLACESDPWAAAEVAGRFLSLCRRLRMTTTIRRRFPDRRFESLCSAIERARHTKKQWDLAMKLAG